MSDVEMEAALHVKKAASALFVYRVSERAPRPVDAGNAAAALDLLRRAHARGEMKTIGPSPVVAALWTFCETVESWRQAGFPFRSLRGRGVRAMLTTMPPIVFENEGG